MSKRITEDHNITSMGLKGVGVTVGSGRTFSVSIEMDRFAGLG